MKKKIVVFGGGTGSNILLSGLKDYDYDLAPEFKEDVFSWIILAESNKNHLKEEL